jgi:hypothetical protein
LEGISYIAQSQTVNIPVVQDGKGDVSKESMEALAAQKSKWRN